MTRDPPATDHALVASAAHAATASRARRGAAPCSQCVGRQAREARPRQHRSRHASADRSRWIARAGWCARRRAGRRILTLLLISICSRRRRSTHRPKVTTPAVGGRCVGGAGRVVPDPPTPEPSRSRAVLLQAGRWAGPRRRQAARYVVAGMDHKFGERSGRPVDARRQREAFDADELEHGEDGVTG